MKRVIISAGLLALGVVAVRDARAQSTSTTDKPWSVTGTLRGFYDDNYNTQPSGPNKLHSFGFEVRPSISGLYNDGPTSVSAAYYYDLRYYTQRPGHQADQDHRFEVALKHKLNANDYISATEAFVDSQDPEVLNNTLSAGALRANGDNYHNDFTFEFNKQVNSLFGFQLGYVQDWYRYTGALPVTASGNPTYGTLLNRFEHTFRIDSRWSYSDLTTLVLGYQFGITAHTSGGNIYTPIVNAQGIYIPSTARDLYSHYIYGGADHTFADNLKGSLRVGVLATDFHNKDQGANVPASALVKPDSVSPYVDLSVNYGYMDGGTASLGFRDSQNSTDVATTYNQITEAIYGSVTQALKPISPDLTASLTAQFQNSDYNGGSASSGSDKAYLFGLNLAYTINKNLSTEVGYNYDKLTSSLAGRGYSRNRVYIGATATY